jgi:high affinity Mn2+ porin
MASRHFWFTLTLVISLFIPMATHPGIAAEVAPVIRDEPPSTEETEKFDKGSELSWISAKLLGLQLPGWAPKLLGAQFTGIYQNMPAFHSPYQGEKSLRFDRHLGHQFTHSYGIYFGSQVTRSLQAYLDIEMFRGSGISNGLGLGGYVNGDVIRAGPTNLGQGPYIARLYLRYLIPLTEERTDPAAPAMGQLPSPDPTERVEIKFGKLSPSDDMDQNRYANNQRTQFFNYAFLFNPAWDYASDTRGYSIGFSASLVKPKWRLTFGSYQVPTTANGYLLDRQIYRARGDNLELTLKPNKLGTVIRLLAYHNVGRMGEYRKAMDFAALTSKTPSVLGDEKPGREKYGFGINLEQPLADNGETGVFARGGWMDGRTSAWSYTEVDRHLSTGVQVSGVHWMRMEDRLGIAYSVQGLSGQHRHYLAAGGIGMLVGDGKLNYGHEQIFETYYKIQLGRYLQITPDFQYIWNPGYNRDRGPVAVYSLRLHLSY